MDTLTAKHRSENMRRIRSSDTAPELLVRRTLHRRGLRYRIHDKTLPGKPDLVFPSFGTVLFVHGCFWHGCPRCVDGTRKIRSRRSYWVPKIEGNRRRDAERVRALRASGWRVFVIWECELTTAKRLRRIGDQLVRLRTQMRRRSSDR